MKYNLHQLLHKQNGHTNQKHASVSLQFSTMIIFPDIDKF